MGRRKRESEAKQRKAEESKASKQSRPKRQAWTRSGWLVSRPRLEWAGLGGLLAKGKGRKGRGSEAQQKRKSVRRYKVQASGKITKLKL